jgi:protein involved in polysaccharide export with SLBB domain
MLWLSHLLLILEVTISEFGRTIQAVSVAYPLSPGKAVEISYTEQKSLALFPFFPQASDAKGS